MKNMINYIKQFILSRPKVKLVLIIVFILFVIALIGSFQLGTTKSFSIVFGSIFLLFLPGFFTTLIFFPKSDTLLGKKKVEADSHTLDIIERITLAGLLSIVITSLAVFGLYHIFQGSKFIPRNLALAIVFLNMIIGAIAFWKQKWFSFSQALPIAMFPFLVVGINQFTGIILTKHNIMLEFLAFTGVVVIIFILGKSIRKRFIAKK